MHPLGLAEPLLPDLTCRLLPLLPHTIEPPEPPQHREKLRRVSHPLAEFSGSVVDLPHFFGCKTLGSHQCWTQSGEDAKLQVDMLRRIR